MTSNANKENETSTPKTSRAREGMKTRSVTRQEIKEMTEKLTEAEEEYEQKIADLMDLQCSMKEDTPAIVKARFAAELDRLLHADIVCKDNENMYTGKEEFKAQLDQLEANIKREREEARENAAVQERLKKLEEQKAELNADIECKVARLKKFIS